LENHDGRTKENQASKFLTVPTRPVPIDRDRSVAGLLEKMEGAGFGAKQLAEAHRIWLDMLDDNSTIYLCGTGNLITFRDAASARLRDQESVCRRDRHVGHGPVSRHP
jgi:hypothetical protein